MIWLVAVLFPVVILLFPVLMDAVERRLGRDLMLDDLRVMLDAEAPEAVEHSVAKALATAVDRYWEA